MRRELSPRALRWMLSLLFLAAAIPTAVLISQAHSRLKWESLHQQRVLAEELSARIDDNLRALIAQEEQRAFTDYRFLVLAGDPAANFVQRSPLSAFPVTSTLPGIVGYFQLDPNGKLTTPIVPPPGADAASYGITAAELDARSALDRRIRDTLQRTAASADVAAVAPEADAFSSIKDAPKQSVLDVAREKTQNALAASPPAAAPADERVVKKMVLAREQKAEEPRRSADRFSYGRGDADDYAARAVRKEQSAVLETEATLSTGTIAGAAAAAPPTPQRVRAHIFESEVEPMSFERLDDMHFVLFRNVWRERQRYVQGALIERAPFLDNAIEEPFRSTALASIAELEVRTTDATFGTRAPEPLYRTLLSAPLSGLELSFSVRNLPLGPGADVILWTAALLALVLGGGFLALYRLGARQLELGRQQQDFVAAVSHELKTPLTSIRMYGEMLREGWADETKKRSYYDFIYTEAERLSRLIGNVLRLSRLTRGNSDLDLKPIAVGELIDNASSKVANAIERAGFELEVVRDIDADASTVLADADAFCQIVINLVDNALKFSARADRKTVTLGTRLHSNATVAITIRDYGPGVPPKQLRRIFELFYRGENELTRETVGTGIGLALVRELTTAMHGRVDVRNVAPGVEVVVELPVHVA
jgi:signal transduction histidine kinase